MVHLLENSAAVPSVQSKLFKWEGSDVLGAVKAQYQFKVAEGCFVRESQSVSNQSEIMSLIAVGRPLLQRLKVLAARNVSQ
jgi:hypothetical protein